ncbi:hypothetical protein Cni_G15759 [Canna indica]|uniref:Reverse transcriptase domain-containing protein n=1 Tax=Canna indica TaxID=4628 RepID=A0AAQ3KEX5_9LILI|nr:hypothetical protein Cni_G15759 [Canna indica]
MARLDKVYANCNWLSMFDKTIVYHLERVASDHRPLLLNTKPNNLPFNSSKKFNFELHWFEYEEVQNLISSLFNSARRLNDSMKELKILEDIDDRGLSNELDQIRMRCLTNKIMAYNRQIHIKWWSKAKTLWMEQNDKNTKYFQTLVKFKKRKNAIIEIESEGRRICKVTNLVEEFASCLGRGKAPGLDGYNPEFYINYWSTISGSFMAAMNDFYQNCIIPKSWGKTRLISIPKTKDAKKILDYRPIALCNVAYKILAKVLVNICKNFIGQIVSKVQMASVKGRNLHDNILMISEMVNIIQKSKRKRPYFILKLDLEKAFDMVSWTAMEKIWCFMNFPAKMRCWLKACLESPVFTCSINGLDSSHFKSFKGVRQGDSLSPYFFIMMEELLSILIKESVSKGDIKAFKYKDISISHLFFADNILITVKSCKDTCLKLKEVLNSYCNYTNQKINSLKSEIIFPSNCSSSINAEICNIFNIKEGSLPMKHLDIHIDRGRLSQNLQNIIIDKASCRIENWANLIEEGEWKPDVICNLFGEELIKKISKIFLAKNNAKDKWIWALNDKASSNATSAEMNSMNLCTGKYPKNGPNHMDSSITETDAEKNNDVSNSSVIHSDAAWMKENNYTGLGFQISDRNNRLTHKCYNHLIIPDPLSAEIWAIWLSIKAKTLGLKHIKIFTDSLKAMHILKKEFKAPWFLKDIMKEIWLLADWFDEIEWLHLRRSYNLEAHNLAKEGLRSLNTGSRIESKLSPVFIYSRNEIAVAKERVLFSNVRCQNSMSCTLFPSLELINKVDDYQRGIYSCLIEDEECTVDDPLHPLTFNRAGSDLI